MRPPAAIPIFLLLLAVARASTGNAAAGDEKEFWRDWIRCGLGRRTSHLKCDASIQHDLRTRLQPERAIEPNKCKLARKGGGTGRSEPLRILDVGSGPLSTLGNQCGGRPVQLVPTDLLAPAYNRILKGLNVTPPVPTLYADAEHLEARFDASSFDLVHTANALDHAADPPKAIRSMLHVVKPGRAVYIATRMNESTTMSHQGMHRTDAFVDARGHFMLIEYTRDGSRYRPAAPRDLTEELRGTADVVARVEAVWRADGKGVGHARDCPSAKDARACRLVLVITRRA